MTNPRSLPAVGRVPGDRELGALPELARSGYLGQVEDSWHGKGDALARLAARLARAIETCLADAP